MGSIFPNPDTEIVPSGTSAVTQPNSETSTEDPGKSCLFFVRIRVPGIGSSGDRDAVSVKAPRLLRCPVRLCRPLQIRGRECDFRAGPYPYPQQVSKVNSL
ncbi:hypothetical protein AVEN_17210-1 [Araneus ventricosus]|uniref:Uncharacterized protein n=1 Tax=Araneus ventricosus TaxID=182803 RepID=A0A4Y2VJL9_ARAVE|nr:hypothetical protein AVEN_17210-1 [Araneus ventricosus]